jgi:hypothetical protein
MEIIYTWLETQVLGDLRDESRGDVPRLAIVNTGAMRLLCLVIWNIFHVAEGAGEWRYNKSRVFGKRPLEERGLLPKTRLLLYLHSPAPSAT